MKKTKLLIIIALCCLTFIACTKKVEYIGIVESVHENRILVFNPERDNSLISFKVENMPEGIQSGDRVKIIYDGVIALSYPGQARAMKVLIIE